MHGERTRVSDGVGNRGSGGEYNNQPLSGINSGGNAVRGDGDGGRCSGGARRRRNLFYVPEMRVYRISRSAELFPQHCQVPNLSRDEHLKALTEELQTETTVVAGTMKGKALLKVLRTHLDTLISPPTTPGE